MPTPNLGYGQTAEAPINAVNQWMRTQPWYQQLLQSWGQNPNSVHLNDAQKAQVIKAAQANGVVVDEGHNGQEIDDSGNFQAKGHKLRNTLIVAGLAAATLATMGAAGAFSGAAAAGMGAGSGAGAAGAGAGLAGIEGGAAGLSSGALGALGTGAMGATALGAGAAGAGAAGAGLASTAIGSGMAPAIAGGTSGAGMGAAAGTGGTLSSIFGYAKKGLDTYNAARGALTDAGQVAGNDSAAAAQGRLQQGLLQQNQDRNALGLFDSKLAAAKQALGQHSELASQAARGDLLANAQDAQITGLPSYIHMGQVSGGLRPSALGPNARQAGATLSRNALLQLLQGDTNLPTAPSLTPLPDASGYDAFTKGLSRVGAYAGALDPLLQSFIKGNGASKPQPTGTGNDYPDWMTEGIG